MALIEITEDLNQQKPNRESWATLMTDEQRKRGDYYSTQYAIRKGELNSFYTEWEEIKKLYECERLPDEDPDWPNSMIPVMLPTIEGQVASMMEARIDIRHVSNVPSHKPYMVKLDAASEYYRKKSRFLAHFKDVTRDYELYGNAWVTVSWEEGFGNSKSQPKGFPRIQKCSLNSVLVDGSIKDSKDIQYARSIIHEIGHVPIYWAREEYGDDLADALLAGYNPVSDGADASYDDSTTFTLLHVWTRQNEFDNLQLIEMDANGLVLRESDPAQPYYKYVNNEYPFGIVRMMPQQDKLYGFGDGKVLKPIQETVNKLTDELELAARYSAQARTYVDPSSRLAPGQITSNPADIVYAKNPKETIYTVPAPGINPVIPQMISYLFEVAQQATRFHNIMTGNIKGVSATATQINTQVAQGTVGIQDKKTDVAEVMAWADAYALKLCIEKWDRPFWAGIGGDSAEFIDIESFATLPGAVPTTGAMIDEAVNLVFETGESELPPPFTAAVDEKGETIFIDIDFETQVMIGEGIPRGRTDMYNILLGLSQIQIVDKETGMAEPLITPKRMREAMEEILGMKLKTQEEEMGEVKEAFMQEALNQLNPVGDEGNIQMPQVSGAVPDNLQGTVPQMPDGDSRRVSI